MSSSISRQVLFIVEGKSDEPRLLKEMEPILSKTMGAKIRCYKAQRDIYTFFHNIDTGPDGDGVLAYLKSMKSTDSEGLLLFPEGERPETVFSSIYLIFDFDPQASLFNAQKIKELCSFFSDETENGKLLLNFPMIESLRHVLSMNPKDESNNIEVDLDGLTSDSYKRMVNNQTIFRSDETHPYKRLNLENAESSLYVNAYRYLMILEKEADYLKKELDCLSITLKELNLCKKNQKVRVINMFILILLGYKEYLRKALNRLG